MEQFQNEVHLAVATPSIIPAIVERALEANGIPQNIGLAVPSFLEITSIVMATDYLAILPQALASHLAAAGRVQIVRLPFQLPAYGVRQHWHEQYSFDPAVRWLRGLISELCSEPNLNGKPPV